MKNKCDKFESYFVFRNDEEFMNHISECEDCHNEFLKQKQVSSLIKEVSDVYKTREKKKIKQAFASCFAFLMIFFAGFGVFTFENYHKLAKIQDSEYGYIYDMGFPVDEYGLLKI